MGKKTGISWTDHTFNPWHGCQKISPACDHCYAERDSKRFAAGQVLWGVGSERRTFGDKHWQGPHRWNKQGFAQCRDCGLRFGPRNASVIEHRLCPQCGGLSDPARRRVFCASMGDWLDLDAPITEFVRLLDTIRRTPELDWLLLSKRIGNWRKRLQEALGTFAPHGLCEPMDRWEQRLFIGSWLDGNPPANVWLGATVVNQEEADRDILKLLAVPARVRFLSIEPMLGPINLHAFLCMHAHADRPELGYGPWCDARRVNCLHWVIAGGESGPHARPSHPDWFRSLRDQCDAAGVAFHFKQWGEWAADPDDDRGAESRFLSSSSALGAYAELMVRVGKRASGRLLDGIEHNGFPTA